MLNPLTKDKTCTLCPLSLTAKQPVWGEGPLDAEIMFIAQNPGKHENEEGKPMVDFAKTGKEFNWLLVQNGFKRREVYVTNLVKCYRPIDKDPEAEHVAVCRQYIFKEIAEIRPKYIVAIGAFATRLFTGASLENVHGIPFELTIPFPSTCDSHTTTLIPMFHTAAGLHDPTRMLIIQIDFARLRDIVSGKVPSRHIVDPFIGKEEYEHAGSVGNIHYLLKDAKIIAIDTEDSADGSPWSIQFSRKPGTGYVVYDHETLLVSTIKDILEAPSITTVLHNAVHDIPVLEKMDIFPAQIADTMVYSYLLQSEPQALKPLAYRHHGMEMHSFTEQVGDATRAKALKYLATAVEFEFPDPKPILEWPKGQPHIKQPQNIGKKIARILLASTTKDITLTLVATGEGLKKTTALTEPDDPDNADPYKRWHNIKPEEGREMVEDLMGPMRQGYLEDIDPAKALKYAARDADASIRVYNTLQPNIAALGLNRAFDIDMAAMPMGIEMMRNGFPIDIPYLKDLSSYFDRRLTEQEYAFTKATGENINIGSDQQVAEVLFEKLKLPILKRTKITRQPATGDEVLQKLKDEHPCIKIIQNHRELSKLKGTYTDAIPKLAVWDSDSGCYRVHTTIRFTRTATGRLSTADPNLQNQPVRTEDGRKIRGGFIASDGCLLLSCDYSQIELRGMAHVSGDPKMLEVFAAGGDIHTQTAADLFGCSLSQVTKDTRYLCKHINFGIAYGLTAKGLHDECLLAGLDYSLPECQDIIDAWFGLYSGYAEWLRQTLLGARQNGYVTDIFGRIRYIPGVRLKDRYAQEEALRAAGNMPIQALAAGVIKIAMADTYELTKFIQAQNIICRPLLQVHDDLIFEAQANEIDYVTPLIQSSMESAITLKVETPTDPKIGCKWSELEEYHG